MLNWPHWWRNITGEEQLFSYSLYDIGHNFLRSSLGCYNGFGDAYSFGIAYTVLGLECKKLCPIWTADQQAADQVERGLNETEVTKTYVPWAPPDSSVLALMMQFAMCIVHLLASGKW